MENKEQAKKQLSPEENASNDYQPLKPYDVQVAGKVIEQLGDGSAPWVRSWREGANTLPFNPVTGKRYKGINAINLAVGGHDDPRWMTYSQARSQGWQVRKGEKGTAIQYWKFAENRSLKNEQGEPVIDQNTQKPVMVLTELERPKVLHAVVFNAGQIDGIPPFQGRAPRPDGPGKVQWLIDHSGQGIVHDQTRGARYSLKEDRIHIAPREQFESDNSYYRAALHEIGHRSGHPDRLDRQNVDSPPGSVGYAKEELTTQIASMFLGNELGIGHHPQEHNVHIRNWIKILEDDPKELFRAAGQAEMITKSVVNLTKDLAPRMTVELQVSAGDQEQRHSLQLPAYSDAQMATEQVRVNLAELYIDQVFGVVAAEKKMNGPIKIEAAVAGAQQGELKQARASISRVTAALNDHFRDSPEFKKLAGKQIQPTGVIQALKTTVRKMEQAVKQKVNQIVQRIATKRKDLQVSFQEKEAAKQAAGRLTDGTRAIGWDKQNKTWYAKPGADLNQLKQWFPENVATRQKPALSPVDEFARALHEAGLRVNGPPQMDGQLHRVPVQDGARGSRDGAYIGYLDGRPAGFIQNHKTGLKSNWTAKGYHLSQANKQRLKAEALQKQRQREAEAQRRYAEKAAQCRELVERLPAATDNGYLKSKGVNAAAGLKQDENGNLVVPLRDSDGNIWSVQRIAENGFKQMEKDARLSGSGFMIGNLRDGQPILVAEGYATAASVNQATDRPVVAAISGHNMATVAADLKQRYPHSAIFVLGDDDKVKQVGAKRLSPGRDMAEKAAAKAHGIALYPNFGKNKGSRTDWNDLHQARGLDVVKRQVEQGIALRLKVEKQKSNKITETRPKQPEKSVALSM